MANWLKFLFGSSPRPRTTEEPSRRNFDDFRAAIRTTPLARTERFEVEFSFPPAITGNPDYAEAIKNCVVFCEEVQVPGMVLGNKEFPIGPWTYYRNTSLGFLGNEINFTFLTDVEWEVRDVFEAWIAESIDPTSRQIKFPAEIYGEVNITSLDTVDGRRKVWTMHEAMPRIINLVPLGMANVGIARTTVIMTSAYWTSDVVDITLGKGSDGTATAATEPVTEENEGETPLSGRARRQERRKKRRSRRAKRKADRKKRLEEFPIKGGAHEEKPVAGDGGG